jgi:hypothetical protein
LPDVYGWSDVENIKLFQDPYVNPFVCNDASWWKEACPGNGKTLVAWGEWATLDSPLSYGLPPDYHYSTGGKEIFVDDDQALYDQLEKVCLRFDPLLPHLLTMRP